jgi:hypothetical protein
MSGVSVEDQAAISAGSCCQPSARWFSASGVGSDGGHAVAAELAALFLNLALDPELSLFDFDNRHRVEIADRRSTVLEAFDAMDNRFRGSGPAQQCQPGLFHSRWGPYCRGPQPAQPIRCGIFQFH